MHTQNKPTKDKMSWRTRLDWFMAITVSLFIAHHLLMTICYLMPANPARNSIANWVQNYMSQMFSQNWHLFSPTPGKTYVRFEVRCPISSEKLEDWKDSELERQSIHDWTRITSISKTLHYYRNLGNTLWRNTASSFHGCMNDDKNVDRCYQFAVGKIRDSSLFPVAERYAANVCNATAPVPVPFRVTLFQPKDFSKRTLTNEAKAPMSFEFVKGYTHEN